MTRRPLAGVPVKPFGVAKGRLAPLLDATARRRLGRALALRTAALVAAAGAEPVIVTADPGVVRWAEHQGLDALGDPGAGLDLAARTVVAAATAADRPWVVIHADLPLLTTDDVVALLAAAEDGMTALAPATDGGTNAIAGTADFPFAYGPGSFHRHLRAAGDRAAVVIRPGLAVDLDTPRDLVAAIALPDGEWLAGFVPAGAASA